MSDLAGKKLASRFTVTGLLTVLVLLLVGTLLQVMEFDFFGLFSKPADKLLLSPVISVAVAAGIIYLWYRVGTAHGPRISRLIVANPLVSLLFGRAGRYYFEQASSTWKASGSRTVKQVVNLMVAWLSISASLVSFFCNQVYRFIYRGESDPSVAFLASPLPLEGLLKFLLIVIIAPLLLAFIIPVSWVLQDLQLKAYHAGTGTIRSTGKEFEQKFRNYLSAGAVLAIGGSFGLGNLVPKFLAVLSLVLYCTFHVSLIAILIVTFYSLVFQPAFHDRFVETVAVPRGRTVIELDRGTGERVTATGEGVMEKKQLDPSRSLTGPGDQPAAVLLPERLIREILDVFDSFPEVEEQHGSDPWKFVEATLVNRLRFYQVQKPFKLARSINSRHHGTLHGNRVADRLVKEERGSIKENER